MNRIVGVVLISFLPFAVQAQIHRYMVFFNDKAETIYSISNPEAFLSDRSIERRTKYEIPITEMDFPVNQSDINSLKIYGVVPFHTSRWMNAVLVETEESILESLVEDGIISSYEFVAPNAKLQSNPAPVSITFSPQNPAQTSLNSEVQLEMIGAEAMHDDGYTGEDLLIAMFDAGFKNVNITSIFSHVFNEDKLLDVKDFKANYNDAFLYDDHGTSALSCIASKSTALTGTAYDASFALYITEDSDTEFRIEEYNWLFAAERADSLGADIISSSLGYFDFDSTYMNYTYDQTNGSTSVVSRAAKMASDRGILVVNSAGNEGANVSTWPYIVMPCDVDEVLAVAAVNQHGVRANFSSVGPAADGTIKPDVAALGVNVVVLNESNEFRKLDGTSFAAPLVTGLAAGLWQKFPELNNRELKDLILSSSNRSYNPDTLVGYGIPNYTYAGTGNTLSVREVLGNVISVFPNPFRDDYISIKIENEYLHKTLVFTLFSPEGKMVSSKSVNKYRRGDIFHMDINDIQKGIYILNVKTEGISKNVKLLRY